MTQPTDDPDATPSAPSGEGSGANPGTAGDDRPARLELPRHRGAKVTRTEILPVAALALFVIVTIGISLSINTSILPTSSPTADVQGAITQPSPEATTTVPGEVTKEAPTAEQLREQRRLARVAARAAKIERRKKQAVTIRVGSFNILGSQHTAPGGIKGPGWPSGGARMPGTLERIRAHDVDVLGLQEVQPEQLRSIVSGTGYASYPGSDVGSLNQVNSIIYDPEVFEFVDGSTIMMSNGNGVRAAPIIRLRHRASDREMYFLNAHPPSGSGGGDVAKRVGGFNQIVSAVNDLKKSGLPVFVTGDMNDRARFFCHVLPPTGMVASVGGSTAGGCRPPGLMPVDWVVATSDVSFSNYSRDETPIRRRISDHFFISATATVAAID